MELLLALLLAVAVVTLAATWSSLKTERERCRRLEDRLAASRREVPVLVAEPETEPVPEPVRSPAPPPAPAPAAATESPDSGAATPPAPQLERVAATLAGPAERLADSIRAAELVLQNAAERLREPMPPSTPSPAIDDAAPQDVSVASVEKALATAERVADERSRLGDDVRSLRTALERVTALDGALQRSLSELSRASEAILPLAASVSGLADRANLLGLNVSLLAARAGEAGVPFEDAAAELRGLFEEARRLSRELSEAARRSDVGARRVGTIVEESAGAAATGQERGARASERLGTLEDYCSQLARLLEETVRSVRDGSDACHLQAERLATVRSSLEARSTEATRLRADAEAARAVLRSAAERIEALRLDGSTLRTAVERVVSGA